jgi:hypothetical protein
MALESGAMNVFQLLITAIAAVAVLFVVVNVIGPLFDHETPLVQSVEPILTNAQARLGENVTIGLNLKKDQTIRAKNFDTPLRSVAFACTDSTLCCDPTAGANCKKALTITPALMTVQEPVKTSLTARCDPIIGIQACKVYIGKIPAQLELQNVTAPTTMDLSTGNDVVVKGTLLYTGELSSGTITLKLTITENRLSEGKQQDVVVAQNAQTLPSLLAGKHTSIELHTAIADPGTYRVRVEAQADDSGVTSQDSTLRVSGEHPNTCVTTTTDPAGTLNPDTGMCVKKKYCDGCSFAFECRHAWEDKGGVTGVVYDENRGTNTFTYAIYAPTSSGICR